MMRRKTEESTTTPLLKKVPNKVKENHENNYKPSSCYREALNPTQ